MLVLSLLMTITAGTAFANQGKGNSFKDINGNWGYQSILKLQELNLLNGYADGTFKPDNTLTQDELAVIIQRLVQMRQNSDNNQDVDLENDHNSDFNNNDSEGDTNDSYLKDVPGWAKKAVADGVQNNYLNLKRFHSQVQCDRLTAAIALAKALNLKPVTDFTTNPFNDRLKISDADYGYLLALYNAGYIKGYPDGNFNPNSLLRRAEMAKILDNILNNQTNDKTLPTWTTESAVTASSITSTSLVLKWAGASDNEQVIGYKVIYDLVSEPDVQQIKFVSFDKTTKITGLLPDNKYNFKVEARDAAGNWSNDGPSTQATTLESSDLESPTWPNGAVLTIDSSLSTPSSIDLKWPNALDNVGVVKYFVYKNDIKIATLDAGVNSFTVIGLDNDITYIFKVRAFDAEGNGSVSLSAQLR